ncbi:cation-transporting P-type ATPase [Aestuariispira insulae]|uniref:P-type E1-E2 ATPase n=1 Tax=Aestuariispira insulae TaxID=1461337 RepID=A0A3D9HRG2_9PROT|nr:cation-transporting P-type ATPase [Aestuariispira insulae]RED52078.1 P-type E1-E2 ATPase [Aestuariispira insulae]
MQEHNRTARWHCDPAEAALVKLQSTPAGLAEETASIRLGKFGPNRLPAPPKRPAWRRFLSQFHNILIYVLLASAAITSLLGHLFDTSVIAAVVLINAVIGYLQEGKAERAMDAIRQMLAPRASVLRDGERHTVDAETLVPGDIVLLEAGEKIPADLRLTVAHGLQVQEAVLTGESLPVDKQVSSVDPDAALGDRTCMAFSGTLVSSGLGRGVVTATGAETEIGRISRLLARVETLKTPLILQMDRFAKWLTGVILAIAMLLLVYGHVVVNLPFAEIFMAVVGLSVAAIPEGLPAVLTITLALGVQAMARRNAIVRRLPAIETLGSVSVICSDKTGTLTRNEMMVVSVVTDQHLFSLRGRGYEPRGTIHLDNTEVSLSEHDPLREIGRIATLCNDAVLQKRDETWIVEGDPMEGALLALTGKLGMDPKRELSGLPRTDTIPFDAKHRFMATLHHDHERNAFIAVKGAPEKILSMCSHQRIAGDGKGPLDLGYWQQEAEAIASRGQRVLALAVKPVDKTKTTLDYADVEQELTLIGLVGLIDPPRQDAIDAVAECHRAGIRVKMITGDHQGTAAAIGRQVGLNNPDRVLTGADLDRMDDQALSAAVAETDIFARTSPEHKLRLVMALQSRGMTVAMTGDGVNDAPALKRADAGIAMGLKGSEAAKEAAEFVLADDNFVSIAAAVREGRTVYDNIKKVISWTLPTNAGEAMTIIVALLFGMTLPITPIQILWVNLITAVTLGVALAFEPTEKNTMRRPPRPKGESILSAELAWYIILVSLLFLGGVFGIYNYALAQGYSLELARTMALNTLVVMEIFNLFFIRNIHGSSLSLDAIKGTRAVWIAVLTVTAAQFAMTYLPPLQKLFGTQSVPLVDGLLILLTGILLFVVIEGEKQIRLSFRRSREAKQLRTGSPESAQSKENVVRL